MFKTVQPDLLVTATGGSLQVNPNQVRPQSPINIKPPVWPRRVEGHPVTTQPSRPLIGW